MSRQQFNHVLFINKSCQRSFFEVPSKEHCLIKYTRIHTDIIHEIK